MRGYPLPTKEVNLIKVLRANGNSLTQICRETGIGRATVYKYMKDVPIPESEQERLRFSRKFNSLEEWEKASIQADSLTGLLTQKEKILVLASLYWGEGTKRKLNIINSDPELIRVVALCLKEIGVKDEMFRITLRIYEDIDKEEAINYWANVLKLPCSQIIGVNVLSGKKIGKLKYGMCRMRVTRGARYFKLIMSLIGSIKKKI
jgi:hypothetical protein